MKTPLRLALSTILLTAALTSNAHSAMAIGTTIHVDTSADDTTADSFCTLREAINSANGNDNTGHTECEAGTGDDLIVFDGNYTITLGSELPGITGTLTITGNGAPNTKIQANASPDIATYRPLYVSGDLTLDGVTVQNGRCNGSCDWGNYYGGGIVVNAGGILHLHNSTVSNNVASGNENALGGGIYVWGGGTAEINNSTIAGNSAYIGGGVGNNGTTTITDSVVLGNQAVHLGSGLAPGGGGIGSGGVLTVSGSTFQNNSAEDAAGYTGQGGAIKGPGSISSSTFLTNTATAGGAIYLYSGSLDVTGSTFDQNHASPSGATTGGGGAIEDYLGTLTITNSTFSGNTADTGFATAVRAGTQFATLSVVNSTFSGNGNGPALSSAATILNLKNNILANGAGTYDCLASPAPTINTGNLIEHNNGTYPCGTPAYASDPMLGPLASNGGPTQTFALLAGSPAIDNGDGTTCNNAVGSPDYGAGDTDQRGLARPQGAQCDIGALERVPFGVRADFDSEGVSDMGYFHPATGLWSILQSGQGFGYGAPQFFSWGQTGDLAAAGDYDGDGRWDPAVRRPPGGGQSAAYLMLLSTTGYDFGQTKNVPAGWPGLSDTPLVGDFNGDGISDPAIFRGSTGVWIIPLSPSFGSYIFKSWGQSGDTPIGADVDGDGQTDIGYWRPSTGVWGFLQSSQGYSYGSPLFFNWGTTGDLAAMADYDGDGMADPAVVIPASGGQSRAYRILLSTLSYNPASSVTIPAGWAGLGDVPVPADYDGDGKADAGIWRGNTGIWIIPKSSTNNASYMFAAWGASGDQVVK